MPCVVETGAEQRNVELPERHTEDDHPEHHRARHLGRMAQKTASCVANDRSVGVLRRA
jgi:hypothetical protein